MQEAVLEQGLHEKRNAARLEQILGHVGAAGFQIGDIGRALKNLGDGEEIEIDAAFMCDRRDMQRAIGRSAGCGNDGGGIFERLAGYDIARTDLACQQSHHHLAGQFAEPVADLVGRRRAGGIRQRKPDRLRDGRHRIGRELGAAGAGRRTSDGLEFVEIFRRYLANGISPDSFEEILHRDRLAAETAR